MKHDGQHVTRYPDQPVLQPVHVGRAWLYRLICRYQWQSKTERIVVFEDFEHDGASVPRVGWSLSGLTPTGAISAAAVVHDWLYRHDGKLPRGSYAVRINSGPWIESPGVFTRAQADRLFLELMRGSGIRWTQRRLAYAAVRVGARRW